MIPTLATRWYRVMGAVALTACASCQLFPDGRCIDETRTVEIRVNLAALDGSGATGSAVLLLQEARRNSRSASEESVIYGVYSTLDRQRVTAIHLHRANDVGHGTPLYTFPIKPGGAEANITVIYTIEPYAGTTPYGTLFNTMVQSPLAVDVHVGDPNVPVLRGTGTSTNNPWSRPYCS